MQYNPFYAAFNRKALRQGNSLYTTSFRANSLLYLTDAVTGQFLGGAFTDALARVHREASVAIQLGMVQELQRSVADTGRHQRPDRTLEIALMDERNSVVTATGFNTLLPQWMNQSQAKKYWRQIELGNPKVYRWRALFTNDVEAGPWSGPWSPTGMDTRGNRSGGGWSRPGPPDGYKHSRMPQNSARAVEMNVGPFPAYRYSRGGQKALDRFPFLAHYTQALKGTGINVETQRR